jgi:hypothetical protein
MLLDKVTNPLTLSSFLNIAVVTQSDSIYLELI